MLTGGEMDDLGRHASDKLGQPMASQISPEAIGARSKARSGPAHSHLEFRGMFAHISLFLCDGKRLLQTLLLVCRHIEDVQSLCNYPTNCSMVKWKLAVALLYSQTTD